MAKLHQSRPLFRIDRIYSRSLAIIEKEMSAIEREQELEGKLCPHSSKDLRDYVYLLEDMKEAQLKIEADRKAKAEAASKAQSTAELEAQLAKAEKGAGG